MQDQRLTISQRQVNPDFLILDFCGSMTSPFEQELENTTRELRNSSHKNIAFNLTSVSCMDGAGVKLLFILCVTLRKANRRLSAFGLNDELRGIFQLTRMDAVLRICRDERQLLERGTA